MKLLPKVGLIISLLATGAGVAYGITRQVIGNATLSTGVGLSPAAFVNRDALQYSGDNFTVNVDAAYSYLIPAIDLNGFNPGILTAYGMNFGSIIDSTNSGKVLTMLVGPKRSGNPFDDYPTLRGQAATAFGDSTINNYSALGTIDCGNNTTSFNVHSNNGGLITLNTDFKNVANATLPIRTPLLLTKWSSSMFDTVQFDPNQVLQVNSNSESLQSFNKFVGATNSFFFASTPVMFNDSSVATLGTIKLGWSGNNVPSYAAIDAPTSTIFTTTAWDSIADNTLLFYSSATISNSSIQKIPHLALNNFGASPILTLDNINGSFILPTIHFASVSSLTPELVLKASSTGAATITLSSNIGGSTSYLDIANNNSMSTPILTDLVGNLTLDATNNAININNSTGNTYSLGADASHRLANLTLNGSQAVTVNAKTYADTISLSGTNVATFTNSISANIINLPSTLVTGTALTLGSTTIATDISGIKSIDYKFSTNKVAINNPLAVASATLNSAFLNQTAGTLIIGGNVLATDPTIGLLREVNFTKVGTAVPVLVMRRTGLGITTFNNSWTFATGAASAGYGELTALSPVIITSATVSNLYAINIAQSTTIKAAVTKIPVIQMVEVTGSNNSLIIDSASGAISASLGSNIGGSSVSTFSNGTWGTPAPVTSFGRLTLNANNGAITLNNSGSNAYSLGVDATHRLAQLTLSGTKSITINAKTYADTIFLSGTGAATFTDIISTNLINLPSTLVTGTALTLGSTTSVADLGGIKSIDYQSSSNQVAINSPLAATSVTLNSTFLNQTAGTLIIGGSVIATDPTIGNLDIINFTKVGTTATPVLTMKTADNSVTTFNNSWTFASGAASAGYGELTALSPVIITDVTASDLYAINIAQSTTIKAPITKIPVIQMIAMTGSNNSLIIDSTSGAINASLGSNIGGSSVSTFTNGTWGTPAPVTSFGSLTLNASNGAITLNNATGNTYSLEPVHDLLNINTRKAKTTICKLVLSLRSQFFHSLLHLSNQANERSTTHLLGITANI